MYICLTFINLYIGFKLETMVIGNCQNKLVFHIWSRRHANTAAMYFISKLLCMNT